MKIWGRALHTAGSSGGKGAAMSVTRTGEARGRTRETCDIRRVTCDVRCETWVSCSWGARQQLDPTGLTSLGERGSSSECAGASPRGCEAVLSSCCVDSQPASGRRQAVERALMSESWWTAGFTSTRAPFTESVMGGHHQLLQAELPPPPQRSEDVN